MCQGGGRTPSPAALLPEAARPPSQSQEGGTGRKRKKRPGDRSGTLLTGPGGVTDRAPTQEKTLLGQ